jgi:hypothetical protein
MDNRTLDLFEGLRRQEVGVAQVYLNNFDWVDKARVVAKSLAVKHGAISIDDVLSAFPRPPSVHPNATGAIFKEKIWVKVGYKPSEKPSARARIVGVYKLL